MLSVSLSISLTERPCQARVPTVEWLAEAQRHGPHADAAQSA